MAHVARTTTDHDKPYPICGAKNREGGLCGNRMGMGTDHLGEGRCKFHGGRNQSPLAKNWKNGMQSQVKHPQLQEKVQELVADFEVFDLRKQILQLQAIAELTIEEGELIAAAKVIEAVTKASQRLHEIEVGRRYVISVENVSIIIERIVEVVNRHVPDEYQRSLIARDLAGISISTGSRTSTQLSSGPIDVIEGRAVEVVAERRVED